MKVLLKVATASALALMIASPVLAQTRVVGIESLDDRIDDIQDDVADDLAEGEDSRRFGDPRFQQGWTGSFALGGSATSGNTDTSDITFAGRMRYGSGDWNHTFGLAGEYSEDNSVTSKKQLYATYDANRYFTDRFYMFGLASLTFDDFGTNRLDGFLGFGPGYRVISTPTQAWRVQAGPGVRYIEDQFDNDETEVAGIASSRYYVSLSETAFLSNDTDILFSDTDTRVLNDLGVTTKLTDVLSARFSLLTDYNSDPAPGKESTDNSIGISLVVGF